MSLKKYDGKIDYSNKTRIIFIERMSSLMINFVSTSDEVNSLIDLLYSKLTKNIVNDEIIHKDKNNNKIEMDKDRIKIEVNDIDLFLYGYTILLYEYNSWTCNDVLDEIIKDLYYKLYDLVYPKFSDDDKEKYKFYIEYEN